jgi:DNA-binding NarL/FixJ family response regulator
MQSTIRHIVIADDHQLFAEGILSMMSRETDYRFTHVSRGDLLIESLDELKPDLILLDLKMPGMDGITALTHLKSAGKNIKVIVLSTYTDAITINNCLHKGADAFLLKNVSIAELKKCIQDVLSNQKSAIGKMANDVLDVDRYTAMADVYKITRREWEILQLIKEGFTNQQISTKLNLSIYTTETHRKNIMQKLKLKTPVELIKFMLENNL